MLFNFFSGLIGFFLIKKLICSQMVSPMHEKHAGCPHTHFPTAPVHCLLLSLVLSGLSFLPLNAYGSSVSTPRIRPYICFLLTLGHASEHQVFRHFCRCISFYVFLQFWSLPSVFFCFSIWYHIIMAYPTLPACNPPISSLITFPVLVADNGQAIQK